MCITSLTTSVAFLANFLSSLIPVQTFGIYAAIIVQANFLLAVTYLPLVIILHQRWFGSPQANCSTLKGHMSMFFGDWWPRNLVFKRRILTVLLFAAWIGFSLYKTLTWGSLS